MIRIIAQRKECNDSKVEVLGSNPNNSLFKIEGDLVAQLAEHIPFKDGVLGSNPSRITNDR